MPGTDVGSVATPQALQFFDGVHESFLAACGTVGRAEFSYKLGTQPFSIALAGPALQASLMPALAHLQTVHAVHAADAEDFTICAWDAHSTGVFPPAPAWTGNDYHGHGGIRGFADGRIRAAFDSWLGMLSLYDVKRRLALCWFRDSRKMPITIVGTPLRVIFQWWADLRDRLLVHAAAVGNEAGCAVIAGASGSGKSTTALVALQNGLRYAGDDFVLVEPEPEPRVHCLYSSAKIDERTLTERFSELGDAIHDRNRLSHEKHVLFVHRHWPDRIATTLPICAVLLPIVTGQTGSRLVPAGSGEALRALVPGVLPFPGMRGGAVERLARLVRRVPAYRLELGTETPGIAAAIRSVLS